MTPPTILPAEPLVEARQLSKVFQQPPGHRIPVFQGIDLAVHAGEIVALLGPSGSGKSTLLRLLTGLAPPSDGQVLVHGRPLDGVHPGAALVFQNFALFPWLTVLENVELGLKAQGVTAAGRRRRALAAIDLIGLDGFEEAYPKELSGGMMQRVGFARALVVEPELLCLDEPFSALDVLTAENLRGELLALWRGRELGIQAIVIVTHSIEEAVYLADRAIILGKDPGRVRAEIPIDLPHERRSRDPGFQALVDRIYTLMTHAEADRLLEAAAAGEVPICRQEGCQTLPHAMVGALAGLLELLDDRGGQEDLYRLGQDLHLEVDDLLPITDATNLLGMTTLHRGDLALTDEGRRFVAASILEKKEIFRRLALARVELIVTIRQMLQSKANRSMPKEVVITALERHFSKKEALRQLQTAIDWGRYAEVFAYDERARLLYFED